MELQYIEDLINDLNGEYFDNGYEDFFPFELVTVGCVRIIKFCNYRIWNSEDDPRNYLEELHQEGYEDLEIYLRRVSGKLVKQLSVVF